jgi:CheY-like chemotaxis protein
MIKLNEVLLIDDSRGTNILNKRLLDKMGIANKVTIANNGMEALNYLISLNQDGVFPNPELIFLDINMPIMDGYQFLEKYTEMKSKINIENSVFMLSSSESEVDLKKSKKFKIVKGFKSKPLTKEEVQATINNLLTD